MPIYEYCCADCHKVFEEWTRHIDDNTVQTCPDCGGEARRIVSNTSFVLKGGGWYVTDYGYRKGKDEDGGGKEGGKAVRTDGAKDSGSNAGNPQTSDSASSGGSAAVQTGASAGSADKSAPGGAAAAADKPAAKPAANKSAA